MSWLQSASAAENPLNGFSIERHTVPREEIISGGPPRDGIRSVDVPELASPEEAARWCAPGNPVIGVAVGDEAHAYPVHLLEYHQVVKDEVGGVPIVVTFDPLTGTPRAYRRVVGGRTLQFGVSGLIYRSSFLIYDRETESLWSPFLGRAIAGPLAGSELEPLRVRQESFAMWLIRHPGTTVLARPDPKQIDYRYSPFATYWVTAKIPFPVPEDAIDDRYHPKEVVLGVSFEGVNRAYLGSILTAAGGRIVDDFRGRRIRVEYDPQSSTFSWEAPEEVRVTDAYWFAWKAFHKDTEIWNDAAPPEGD